MRGIITKDHQKLHYLVIYNDIGWSGAYPRPPCKNTFYLAGLRDRTNK